MNEPNDALAALISEAGFSWAGLARRINDLGANEGRALRYDYTAVNRWVKRGEKPRPPVPTLLAQALSERLSRRVSPSDFGMTKEETLAARGLRYSDDTRATVDTIIDLGRADVKRRDIVKAPFVLAALGAPSRDWLLAMLEETATERGPRQVGMRQVAGIREMFALFQDMDVMRGGGHARIALVEYMQSYVLPLLKRDHEPAVQDALYEAAAEQSYLVGWMAYDDGEHGLAQRYLIQALRLAQAAGTVALGAHVLAGMADQANLLGHPGEALMLARAGRRGLSKGDSPACLADLHILEGRALAALGEASAAAASVVKAEQTLGSVAHDEEPAWAKFIDVPYIFGEAAHCFRDLGQPSELERFANESAAGARRQGRARRGALSEAALSIADLERANVEAAASRAAHVVDLAASVTSSRTVETVRDLQRRMKPFGNLHEVQQFNARADALLGLAI
ncbi:hypothetical protein [Micromonospora sp. HUAS LYJ1]|uniref:hypothetical protein n=1 Tax=Micromonospora sp. HUAS LYJ1 TaxID=3061626 RepID=UPI0026715D4B|nr:hypothetical protein [Micromonospora sp. HUAS LYJ1]WKU07066.1 hypothetical protein Q2K16_08460 [Micromonospora sp. HUAS LYJ1]